MTPGSATTAGSSSVAGTPRGSTRAGAPLHGARKGSRPGAAKCPPCRPISFTTIAARPPAAETRGELLSFFDEDDETSTRVRPRRAASGAGAPPDRRTVLIRQAVLIGGFLIIAVLLILVVRSCQQSAKENALKDYNSAVASIVRESDTQVGRPFFELMRDPGSESAADLETTINGYRGQAEQQYEQAKRLDVPDEMVPAQRSFLITMEQRRDGLASIAARVRTALSDDREAAQRAISESAGAMELFLSSDVILETRTYPFIRTALADAEVGGQTIQRSQFFPGVQWLDDGTVAAALGQPATGTSSNGGAPAPGLHGTGLDSVQVGDLTLQPGAPNRIPSTSREFLVTFTNQGENDEVNIQVVLRIEGAGQPIRVVRTVQSVPQGAQAEATLALNRPPPVDQPVTIRVDVKPVPGEKKTDNNTASYDAIFTQQ